MNKNGRKMAYAGKAKAQQLTKRTVGGHGHFELIAMMNELFAA